MMAAGTQLRIIRGLVPVLALLLAPSLASAKNCAPVVEVEGKLRGNGIPWVAQGRLAIVTNSHLLLGQRSARIRIPDETGAIAKESPSTLARVMSKPFLHDWPEMDIAVLDIEDTNLANRLRSCVEEERKLDERGLRKYEKWMYPLPDRRDSGQLGRAPKDLQWEVVYLQSKSRSQVLELQHQEVPAPVLARDTRIGLVQEHHIHVVDMRGHPGMSGGALMASGGRVGLISKFITGMQGGLFVLPLTSVDEIIRKPSRYASEWEIGKGSYAIMVKDGANQAKQEFNCSGGSSQGNAEPAGQGETGNAGQGETGNAGQGETGNAGGSLKRKASPRQTGRRSGDINEFGFETCRSRFFLNGKRVYAIWDRLEEPRVYFMPTLAHLLLSDWTFEPQYTLKDVRAQQLAEIRSHYPEVASNQFKIDESASTEAMVVASVDGKRMVFLFWSTDLSKTLTYGARLKSPLSASERSLGQIPLSRVSNNPKDPLVLLRSPSEKAL